MASVMVDGPETARLSPRAEPNTTAASPARALVLATVSFALSFAVWGLVGGLAPVFTSLHSLTASQTALLVAVPVLLGSLARLPMGMLTDRFGGRLVFTALLAFSSLAAFVVPLTTSYVALLLAAFLIGMAGSSFAVGAAFVSRWTPAARQGTALGIYGLGTMGQSLAVFVGPVVAARLVGALGGLGGFFPPLLLGVFRDQLGAIWPGFVLLSLTALALRVAHERAFRPADVEWTRSLPVGARQALERMRAGNATAVHNRSHRCQYCAT